LLRPHPKFSAGWQEAFTGIRGVTLSVSKVLNNDATLFHAMAHSRAVVAANTSAELEAAILDCPVFTIKDKTFVAGQDGTIHFGYLAGDLAEVANTLDEHLAQLTKEMSGPRQKGRNETFLKSFLRPMGLKRRASDMTADAIEAVLGIVSEGAKISALPAADFDNVPQLQSLMTTLRSTARFLINGR
jgi:hypothetical protein